MRKNKPVIEKTEDNSLLEELGKRLLNFRKECEEMSQEKISRAKIANEIGISINQMHRLETQGNGTIENLIKVVNYYDSKGFNIKYLFVSDKNKTPTRYENTVDYPQTVLKSMTMDNMAMNTIYALRVAQEEINMTFEKIKKNVIEEADSDF